MSDTKPFYLGQDNIVWWGEQSDGSQGAKDSVDGSWINDATGTVDIKNAAGTSLLSAPISTTYKSGSNGVYYAVIDSSDFSTTPSVNDTIYAEFTLASSGRDGFRRVPLLVQYQGWR